MMEVGIGLPATIRGVTREQFLEWARRAEAREFSTLGTIDRIVYGNYEPLVALTAASAVTERIKLTTAILIAPLRVNAALLAKQVATLHAFSGGRVQLGVAVGGREDDYEASGVDFHTRGKQFDAMLETFERVWSGDSFGYAGAIGPEPPGGRVPLIFGGGADAAFRRAAEHGDGWMMGGGTPEMFTEALERLDAAWKAAGRDGTPRKMALAYYALGDDARVAADTYLHDYYGFLGDLAATIAGGAATDEATVKQYVDAFAGAGCDELILFPCDPDPGQVDLLADAIA
jgi:alkanesulfonate monooxygenase SsuD/methylene tetrahydromethanopterin reductase-like flavin-dependent oxidoreductase (luciferase family)